MLKKESEILKIFAKEPWKKFTFTDIKNITGNKSKSYLEKSIKKFLKEELIIKEMIGRIPLYALNMNKTKAINYAGFILEDDGWSKKQIPYNDIDEFIRKTPTKDYVFIITGSYAKNKQNNDSDIDVVILVEDAVDTKMVYAQLSHKAELNIPIIHLYVFKNEEFLQMLKNKEPNYGKEIAFNNIILSGGQIYIKLIKEAIDYGFTGKDSY